MGGVQSDATTTDEVSILLIQSSPVASPQNMWENTLKPS